MTAMKKYKISKFYCGLYIFDFVIMLSYIPITILCFSVEGPDFVSFLVAAIGLIGLVAGGYSLLFDFHAGTFLFSDREITMHVGTRYWTHSWEQFRDVGIVEVQPNGHGGFGTTCWVYFSERTLSPQERRVFLSKTRRDLSAIAFFQYDTEVLRELLPLLPPDLAERLRTSEQWVIPKKLRSG